MGEQDGGAHCDFPLAPRQLPRQFFYHGLCRTRLGAAQRGAAGAELPPLAPRSSAAGPGATAALLGELRVGSGVSSDGEGNTETPRGFSQRPITRWRGNKVTPEEVLPALPAWPGH